jgi:hypothetical protein
MPKWSFSKSKRSQGGGPPRSTTPGAGHYNLASEFNRSSNTAAQSHTRVAPSTNFGNHAKRGDLGASTIGPGPGTYSPQSGMGTQVNSNKNTNPAYSLGRRTPLLKSNRIAPGPGAYDRASSIGREQATARTSPRFTFGSGQRVSLRQQREVSDRSPGPVYAAPASCTKQVSSTRASASKWSFSKSTRAQHHRQTHGTGGGNPGPGHYPIAASVGPQVSSRCSTAPEVRFGTSNRSALHKTAASGVPFYDLEEAAGVQRKSGRPTAPSFTFGAR